MSIEFKTPDFLSGSSAEEIHSRMMNNLPTDIDDMPGGFAYDFTMPTALEKSELIQFHLVRTLMLMFPMWAWGDWLDYHASATGIVRREAGYSYGTIMVTGDAGTVIPINTIFCTPSVNNKPSIQFFATEETVINDSGSAIVHIKAADSGKMGNVSARTITMMFRPINGIKSVINNEKTTGGTEKETDEALRSRIQEANESEPSYVGNNSDYIRWAKEVVGVGAVTVIPEWDGPGSVKLVVSDSNGLPANELILSAIYDYIMKPNAPLERKAPIGAAVTVVAPETIRINYAGSVSLREGFKLETVLKTFRKNLISYYENARMEGVIKYAKVCAVLINTDGISDFIGLLINGEEKNIILSQEQFPETSRFDFVIT